MPDVRSRRRGRRRAAWVLGVSGVLSALLYAAVCGAVVLGITRTQRFPMERTPADFGLAYQEVGFSSRTDGLPLRGWLIAPGGAGGAAGSGDGGGASVAGESGAPSGGRLKRPVVFVHGRHGNRERGPLLEVAAHVAGAGHPVLTFDLRSAGESGGQRFTLGALEVRDVAGALDFLQGRGMTDGGVGVVGYSLGAATAVLQGAADDRVRAVAEDSGYADLGDILAQQVPALSGLPPFFTPGVVFMARPLMGVDAYAIRPVESARRLAARGVPLLVVHGEADALVPAQHGRRLATAYGPGVETLFVPGAGHVRSYRTDPDAYLARLHLFLDRAEAP